MVKCNQLTSLPFKGLTELSLVKSRLAFVRFLRGRFEPERVHQLHVREGESFGEFLAELELGRLHVQRFVELFALS